MSVRVPLGRRRHGADDPDRRTPDGDLLHGAWRGAYAIAGDIRPAAHTFREITPAMVNWDVMLDTKLVFVTGITAALSGNTASVVRYFVDAATDKGIDVALDVNYRGLLWSPEKAREVLSPIASKARLTFCFRRDTAAAFGIEGDQSECSRNLTLSAIPRPSSCSMFCS